MFCVFCRCLTEEKHCDICGHDIDWVCAECHLDEVHGIILLGENKPQCGNLTPYPEEDAKHFPSIPSNKWR